MVFGAPFIILLLLASCAESQRCYNFSLRVATNQRYKTSEPMWFRIGTTTSDSEWFSVSSFPDSGTEYEWQRDLSDVGSPTKIVVLSLTNQRDIFGFTSIGVNGIVANFSPSVVLDAYAGEGISVGCVKRTVNLEQSTYSPDNYLGGSTCPYDVTESPTATPSTSALADCPTTVNIVDTPSSTQSPTKLTTASAYSTTDTPTAMPIPIPTSKPTNSPIDQPTKNPTPSPIQTTYIPVSSSTNTLTYEPTPVTDNPTESPTDYPSARPTDKPTLTPTEIPTDSPPAQTIILNATETTHDTPTSNATNTPSTVDASTTTTTSTLIFPTPNPSTHKYQTTPAPITPITTSTTTEETLATQEQVAQENDEGDIVSYIILGSIAFFLCIIIVLMIMLIQHCRKKAKQGSKQEKISASINKRTSLHHPTSGNNKSNDSDFEGVVLQMATVPRPNTASTANTVTAGAGNGDGNGDGTGSPASPVSVGAINFDFTPSEGLPVQPTINVMSHGQHNNNNNNNNNNHNKDKKTQKSKKGNLNNPNEYSAVSMNSPASGSSVATVNSFEHGRGITPGGGDDDMLPTILALKEIQESEKQNLDSTPGGDTPAGPAGPAVNGTNNKQEKEEGSKAPSRMNSASINSNQTTIIHQRGNGLSVDSLPNNNRSGRGNSYVTPMGDENDNGENNGGEGGNDEDDDEGESEDDSSDSEEAMAQIRSQMMQKSMKHGGNNGGGSGENDTEVVYDNNKGNHGNDGGGGYKSDEGANDDEKLDVLENDPEFGITPMGNDNNQQYAD